MFSYAHVQREARAMFLRRIRPQGKGSKQTYWELVESYRTSKGSRLRRVCYLGKLSAQEVSGWEKLSRRFDGKADPAPGLFDSPASDDPEFLTVDVNGVGLRDLKTFGQEYLAWTLWRLLGLDDLLKSQMTFGQEHIPWSGVAAILCLSRFCRPSSELSIAQKFYPHSGLQEILGIPPQQVNEDRLYRGLDQLLPHKKAIEQHLRKRLGELFDLSFDILLYDLTSTYFEGQCAANPMARRGYSRDSRPDCLQVVIALIVTVEGYPLGYEVFDGNTADSTTVQEIVEKVEAEHGQSQRIWVMDRGNVSAANLEFIRQRGGQYIVGTPKAMLRQVQGELSKEGWQRVREGIEVKVIQHAGQERETFVLCRSEARVNKEAGMLEKLAARMEKGLEAMKRSAGKVRLKSLPAAYMRLGRLQEQNWRAAACFDVKITELNGRLEISWTQDDQKKRELCGCYLLRTNAPQTDAIKLWKQYIQLVDVEWAFRITKDEMELRPVWHQHAERVKAHILVCFIAYAMWKTLSGWMHASGLGDAPRTLMEELRAIQSGEVMLPIRGADATAGQTRVIRCVTQPDEHTKVLLSRLGLNLPNHLKRYRLTTPEPAAISVMQ
jgi:transposase